VPTVSVPTGLAADGLPLGTQLIGTPFEETRLLAAARWAEAAIGFTAAPASRSGKPAPGSRLGRWPLPILPGEGGPSVLDCL
jgi:hypothetical protein